jgi:hypothetical protein
MEPPNSEVTPSDEKNPDGEEVDSVDPRFVALYYMCSLAGLFMVVGGIWLVYKQKIYLDKEGKTVTEIETPIGKFKTNYPALVLFALGFIPLIYPMIKSSGIAEQIKIRGSVHSDVHPVFIYASTWSDALQEDREFSLSLPKLRETGENYKVVYVAGDVVLDDPIDLAESKQGEVKLRVKQIASGGATVFEPDVQPIPAGFKGAESSQ